MGHVWTAQPREEAFLLSRGSPERPRAKAENVLHVRIKVVWQRHEAGNAMCQPLPDPASLCPWWLERQTSGHILSVSSLFATASVHLLLPLPELSQTL